MAESFMREAAMLSTLNHPNIIRVFGVIKKPGDMGIAGIMTEFARNGSLRNMLE
jgi:serine/threonine protein kinase